jgi:uncharacterized membrane protein
MTAGTAMFGLSLSLANPAGLALLGLAVPVVLLHILKPRRELVTVSSTFLWRAIERPVSAASPWQKLRWSWLLVAQLLAVALLALAVATPVRLENSTLSAHTVFIIDSSGSMAATDGAPDRLASAKQRAVELRKQMPTGGIASIVVASDKPRVVLTTSDDIAAFESALRTVDTTPGGSDFAGAFSLAESLDTSSVRIGFVLLSDGGLTTDEERLLPPAVRYERIGNSADNRSVEAVSVEPRGGGLHARVTVRNHGDSPVTQRLRLQVDGTTALTQAVSVDAESATVAEFDLPPGDRVEAYLDGGDLLPADDVGVAVATSRPDLKVLIVGDPLFWQQLFTSMPGLAVDLAELDPGDPVPTGDGYDVVVYSAVAVPAAPAAPFLAVATPGGVPGVPVSGVAENPAVTLVRGDDPLLRGVDLTTVAIAQSQRVQADLGAVLVGGEGAPLLVRGDVDGQRFVYLTFALTDSNLAVQVAFPILGDRILTELSGSALANEPIEIGQPLPIEPTDSGDAVGPDGQTRSFTAGDPVPRVTIPGFWTVRIAGQPDRLVAVNVPDGESAIAPRPKLAPPTIEELRAVTPARIQHSLLSYVVPPLLAVLILEAWLARRRLGVRRRQWQFAVAARVAVAALLIGALLAPSIPRRSDRVATVFVLDGSASLGPAGDQAAARWIKDALADRPDDALSAVVVFGRDARLDRVLEQSSAFDGPAVRFDDSATDIATAIRLGAAVLPTDARKRVVIVSDGRVTTGDAVTEAATADRSDIRIDVHTIDASLGADVAVEAIDVPRLARVGDGIEITVNVAATRAGTATVVLRRDGTVVDTKTVDVQPGSNPVIFTDNAGTSPGAVLRYQAIVTTPGDTQPKNDAAFAAVPVDGPARVLIVEGTGGEAATLDNALRAGGIATKVIGPAELPDVQTLATYAGVLLVNVSADLLTGEQIEALTTAVRDLGRGLVTIGGERSYGVGGYRDSPINELLPVDSEILDPKRRKTVAEVLSIDTSGSMAACHCAAEGMPSAPAGPQGGVNKTDISRAAAERAIQALTANDEVGVLAWNSGTSWVLDLQRLPDEATITESLGKLRPNGNTNIKASLSEAAEALLASDAELKHIIMFSDGFTDQLLIDGVADEAGRLHEEFGITISVLATGEGSAPSLEKIAVAGNGRFYPGTDLAAIPQIMAEEAVIASRDFIYEGEFLPEITSNDPVVAPLTSSPNLLGYVATTAKPEASTLLRIGPDRDPLLATWQAGLGRVSSWTSDASRSWSQQWADWDGYVDFWSRLTKSTFQAGDSAGAAQAQVRNGQLVVSVEGAANFPDGAKGTAVVSGPDGQRFEVTLDRVGGERFEATIPATRSGTYAVGTNVVDADGRVVLASSTLASESYPAEYAPGQADQQLMADISAAAGGRGEIEATQAFDAEGLRAGVRRIGLTGPFLLAAALLWPIAVALSRLSLRGATMAGARAGVVTAARRVRAAMPKLGTTDPHNAPAPPRGTPPPTVDSAPAKVRTTPAKEPAPAGAPSSQTERMNELLARKRQRQQGGQPGGDDSG